MTVFELRAMLAEMDDDAQVFIFDTPCDGMNTTLPVNVLHGMDWHGRPIIIVDHDADHSPSDVGNAFPPREANPVIEIPSPGTGADKDRGQTSYQRAQTILREAVKEAGARPIEWPGQICPSCGVAFGMHKPTCEHAQADDEAVTP